MSKELQESDVMSYLRRMVNIARSADESDPISVRRAKAEMKAVREANPDFATIARQALGDAK